MLLTTCKVVQIIILGLLIIPELIFLGDKIIKRKKNKNESVISILVFSIIFILLSILIVNMDNTYKDIKFAEFKQISIVFQYTFNCAFHIIVFGLLMIGTISSYILYRDSIMSKNYHAVSIGIKSNSLKNLMKYPHAYYETVINVKKYGKYMIISDIANKELIKHLDTK